MGQRFGCDAAGRVHEQGSCPDKATCTQRAVCSRPAVPWRRHEDGTPTPGFLSVPHGVRLRERGRGLSFRAGVRARCPGPAPRFAGPSAKGRRRTPSSNTGEVGVAVAEPHGRCRPGPSPCGAPAGGSPLGVTHTPGRGPPAVSPLPCPRLLRQQRIEAGSPSPRASPPSRRDLKCGKDNSVTSGRRQRKATRPRQLLLGDPQALTKGTSANLLPLSAVLATVPPPPGGQGTLKTAFLECLVTSRASSPETAPRGGKAESHGAGSSPGGGRLGEGAGGQPTAAFPAICM